MTYVTGARVRSDQARRAGTDDRIPTIDTRTPIPLRAVAVRAVLLLAGAAARGGGQPERHLPCLPRRQDAHHQARRAHGLAVRGRRRSFPPPSTDRCPAPIATPTWKARTCRTQPPLKTGGLRHLPWRGGQAARQVAARAGAVARGDALAPRCVNCHGNHDILPGKDPRSPVAPLNVPFTCGKCHREGTPVQTQRNIEQHNILENYSESIHGEALLKKGLMVAANCVSCHTAHNILPHTDPNSSIARDNIAKTCTKCHAQIEAGAPQDRSAANCGRKRRTCCRLRGLPPAAQGAQGVLHPGHGRRRLHALPCQREPEGARWPAHVGSARRRSGVAPVTPRWPAASATRR